MCSCVLDQRFDNAHLIFVMANGDIGITKYTEETLKSIIYAE